MLAPVVTYGAGLPVTLDEVRAQAIIDFGDDDTLLESYISAATKRLDGPDGILGRALMPQTVVQSFDCLSHEMRLPYGPATALTSVEYVDQDGGTQTLNGARLFSSSTGSYVWIDPATVLPSTNDQPDAVSITYDAGFAEVPGDLKLAITMMVSTFFDFRSDMTSGSISSLPVGVDPLIEPYRKTGL